MTHEITMKSHKKRVEDKKEKNITLKASTIDEETGEEETSKEDEDLTLITRKFKKFIKFNKNKETKFQPRKNSQKKKSTNGKKEKRDFVCYKCNKHRHIKYDCLFYKNKEKK